METVQGLPGLFANRLAPAQTGALLWPKVSSCSFSPHRMGLWNHTANTTTQSFIEEKDRINRVTCLFPDFEVHCCLTLKFLSSVTTVERSPPGGNAEGASSHPRLRRCSPSPGGRARCSLQLDLTTRRVHLPGSYGTPAACPPHAQLHRHGCAQLSMCTVDWPPAMVWGGDFTDGTAEAQRWQNLPTVTQQGNSRAGATPVWPRHSLGPPPEMRPLFWNAIAARDLAAWRTWGKRACGARGHLSPRGGWRPASLTVRGPCGQGPWGA